jgi:hypothetical protein
MPARVITALMALPVGFLVWREFEPLVLFRPVDAVVVWSEVAMTSHPGSRAKHSSGYEAQITYGYEVKGERFVSAQYRRTNMVGSHSKATRMARLHPMGTRVPAWYNPRNPADAVLSREPNLVLIALLGFVWFMLWLFSLASAHPAPRPPPLQRVG